MSDHNSAVAIFDQHNQAEEAVKQLEKGGFDMKTLSIVGKGYHTEENVVGYYNAGDRMLYWGKQGAFWGGFWSLLFGTGFFMIPGIGPMLVAGPLVVSIIAALEGALVFGAVSALAGALASIGIPNNSVVQYEASVRAGKFLMLVHGSPDEVTRAKEILSNAGASQTHLHMANTRAEALVG